MGTFRRERRMSSTGEEKSEANGTVPGDRSGRERALYRANRRDCCEWTLTFAWCGLR